MKTKITQLSMLFIALFFINVTLSAQTGDYEYLFETDGNAEGWDLFAATGPLTVANGVLTYTYGDATTVGLSFPGGTLIDKTNFPIVAIQLSQTPGRLEFHMRDTNGVGGWYNETDVQNGNGIVNYWEIDPTLNAQHVYYWDLNFGFWDNPTETLTDGGVLDLGLLRLNAVAAETSIDIEWMKTFASVAALQSYLATLSTDDVSTKSLTKVISRENGINIVKTKVNSKIEVFNLLGKKLYSSIAKSTDVSITLLSKGLHIVKISDETSVIAKKVILK